MGGEGEGEMGLYTCLVGSRRHASGCPLPLSPFPIFSSLYAASRKHALHNTAQHSTAQHNVQSVARTSCRITSHRIVSHKTSSRRKACCRGEIERSSICLFSIRFSHRFHVMQCTTSTQQRSLELKPTQSSHIRISSCSSQNPSALMQRNATQKSTQGVSRRCSNIPPSATLKCQTSASQPSKII
jgi:hypothetical protein